jgi:hypothetical protein
VPREDENGELSNEKRAKQTALGIYRYKDIQNKNDPTVVAEDGCQWYRSSRDDVLVLEEIP